MATVLILDDDSELGDALRLTLAAHSIDAVCAQSAQQAADLLKEQSYDLVLLDYAMPDQDGLWFMQNVDVPRKTKVILMTGYLSRGMINSMFAAGACGYMIKPFDDETILHNVQYYLNGQINA